MFKSGPFFRLLSRENAPLREKTFSMEIEVGAHSTSALSRGSQVWYKSEQFADDNYTVDDEKGEDFRVVPQGSRYSCITYKEGGALTNEKC